MNICVNGVTRPMTDDELAALEQARQQLADDIESGAVSNPPPKEA